MLSEFPPQFFPADPQHSPAAQDQAALILAEVPQFVHDAQLSYDEFIESPGQETLLLGVLWLGVVFGVVG